MPELCGSRFPWVRSTNSFLKFLFCLPCHRQDLSRFLLDVFHALHCGCVTCTWPWLLSRGHLLIFSSSLCSDESFSRWYFLFEHSDNVSSSGFLRFLVGADWTSWIHKSWNLRGFHCVLKHFFPSLPWLPGTPLCFQAWWMRSHISLNNVHFFLTFFVVTWL